MRCRLDHIVITAPNLELGVAWAEEALGVPMGPGGEHERMGTHNRLLKLQDELYLEVISVNPQAPAPRAPRWFALDDRAPHDPPALTNWVVRTDDIQVAVKASELDLGAISPMTRGPWSWQITIPPNGRQPLLGLAPVLIQWPPGRHPAAQMPASGVSLRSFTIHHPDAVAMRQVVEALGLQEQVSVEPGASSAAPYLEAVLDTPKGQRRLINQPKHSA